MDIQNTPQLTTERLLLRRFTENDVEALYAIYRDEEVNTFLPWFPLRSLEEAWELYQTQYADAYRRERGYRYAICLQNGPPVGYVHLSSEESRDLGYGLRREYWGRGIMTEACRAVVERAKEDGVPFITATHDVRNPRSGEVMKRLGMWYQYTYEELWQPKNQLVRFRLYQLNLDDNAERIYKKYWDDAIVRYVEKEV